MATALSIFLLMFWQKRKQSHWTFIVFSFITIFIVVVSALLIFLFFRNTHTSEVNVKQHTVQTSTASTSEVGIKQRTVQTSTAIRQIYHNKLIALRLQIDALSNPTPTNLVQTIEHTMLSVAVPRNMRASHLSAFLQMEHIVHSNIAPNQMIGKLDNLIQSLLTKTTGHTG